MDFKRSVQNFCNRERITQEYFCHRLGCTPSELRYAGNWPRIAQDAWVAFGAKLEGYVPRSPREERAWAERMLPWIRKFPVKALQKRGHIPHETCGTGAVFATLRFMGVAGSAGFEKSYGYALGTAAPQTYAAWIRQGETLVSCGSARITNKIAIDRELLVYNLKALRRNATGNLRASIATALRGCSISFIEVEPFVTAPYPSCAAYWVGERPVIQVPTTRMTDSTLLENVCRAAWHIVTKPKRSTFLAAPPAGQCSVAGADCDPGLRRFAEDVLLPEADECRLICCGRFEEDRCIRYFSRTLHVRPGILVERLQQQGKLPRRTLLNDFKVAV